MEPDEFGEIIFRNRPGEVISLDVISSKGYELIEDFLCLHTLDDDTDSNILQQFYRVLQYGMNPLVKDHLSHAPVYLDDAERKRDEPAEIGVTSSVIIQGEGDPVLRKYPDVLLHNILIG